MQPVNFDENMFLLLFLLARQELEAFVSLIKYDMNVYKLRTKLVNERAKYAKKREENLRKMNVS